MPPSTHPDARSTPLRRVLVVAYYFPPMGLSGVQRTAKFVKYLSAFGWQPEVLTVEPGGYFAYDASLLDEVLEAGAGVHRTASWDPTRLFGREKTVRLPAEGTRRTLATLSQLVFVPDNKIGWYPHAVRAGRRLLAADRYEAIFATAPAYSGLLIADRLARQARLPLVVDFRDDWVGNPRHVYPTPFHRWMNLRLEARVLANAAHITTINPPIAAQIQRRHPDLATPLSVLSQGYDPADFAVPAVARKVGKMRLLYTGVFYDVQKPDTFLEALAAFLAAHPEARAEVEAVFVGLLPDEAQAKIDALGLTEVVRYEGYVPHPEAVAHIKSADVLWLTIGDQPGAEGISTGKLYEYMGARKPILALLPEGTARETLRPYGAAEVVHPDDVPGTARALAKLYAQWSSSSLPTPDEAYVRRFDRKRLTGELAGLLSDAAMMPR